MDSKRFFPRFCTTASSDRCLYMQGPLKNIDTYLSSNIRESCSSATPFWSGFLVRCILPVLRATLETSASGYHLPSSKTVVPWCLKLKICQLRRQTRHWPWVKRSNLSSSRLVFFFLPVSSRSARKCLWGVLQLIHELDLKPTKYRVAKKGGPVHGI